MSNISKKGTKYNLLSRKADIVDNSYRSDYFIISDLNSTLTAGKNIFTINGSVLLKQKSDILLEILDSEGNPLYYEIGKTGFITYTDTTDLVISVHVYGTTKSGFGKIIIWGTTVDNKSVRWSTNIKINPADDNSSRITFYNSPTLEVSNFLTYTLSENLSAVNQNTRTITGSIFGVSNHPPIYTDFDSINFRKVKLDYRVKYQSTSSVNTGSYFSLQNLGNEMILNISKVSYLDGNNHLTASVDLTQSFFIDEVVNNFEVKLKKPVTYNFKNSNQIVNIIDANFQLPFSDSTYITSSGLIVGTNPDGDPDPNIFFYQVVSGVNTFLRESFLDLTYKNLKTLTGKVHRHKVYRRSLNKASDFECISDEPLRREEVILDKTTINRFFSEMGSFYNMSHIQRYYHTSSNNITLSQSSDIILNSMIVNCSTENLGQSDYIILKNDTSLKTLTIYTSSYVPYDENSDLQQSGSAYDSNFISLHGNSDYLFSSNVDITKLSPATESKLIFYFTGSYNTSSGIDEQNYVDGKGLKLKEYVLDSTTGYKEFRKDIDFEKISFLNDYIGTIAIVPVNVKSFRIDNLSLSSYSEFGFSPDSFVTRVACGISIKNEQFEIRSEFLDINSNSIYTGISKIVTVDKYGESLLKNIPGFTVADSSTIVNILASGSSTLTLSSSRAAGSFTTNRATLSVIESFAVHPYNTSTEPFLIAERRPNGARDSYLSVSGSLNVTGSTNLSGSLSMSGSINLLGSTDLLNGTSSRSISSSYSLSGSYGVSGSYSSTSSYMVYGGATHSPSMNYFTASMLPSESGSARTSSGYIESRLSTGVTIYIPYYTAI